jgi:multicomponent Na+:H+ antiporter subunit G
VRILEAIFPWMADALVVLGVFVVTIGVYGMIRMPDTFTKLHAASKAVFLGVISLMAASAVTGDKEIILRVLLITFFLLATTPVSAHVIARAAFFQGEKMKAPRAIDESEHHLNEPPNP